MNTSITSLVTGTLPRFVLGWLFPAMIVVGASGLVVARVVDGVWIPPDIRHHSESTLLLAFLAVSLVSSYLLALLSATFYRIVMGAALPRGFQQWLISYQLRRWEALSSRWQALATSMTRDQINASQRAELGLLNERLTQFPSESSQFMPTKLGNQLRAIEEYGWRTFGLDTSLFQDEMLALVPSQLVDNRRDASSVLDLLVALEIVAGLLAVISLVAAIVRTDIGLVYAAIVAAAIAIACGRLRGDAVRRVVAADRAVVDAARRPLAMSWGLTLPETFDIEIQMWQALARYVVRGDSSGLTPFRSDERKENS